jgi:hypothetical protein
MQRDDLFQLPPEWGNRPQERLYVNESELAWLRASFGPAQPIVHDPCPAPTLDSAAAIGGKRLPVTDKPPAAAEG